MSTHLVGRLGREASHGRAAGLALTVVLAAGCSIVQGSSGPESEPGESPKTEGGTGGAAVSTDSPSGGASGLEMGSGGVTGTGASAAVGGQLGSGGAAIEEDLYPCDGTTDGYDVVVTLDGNEEALGPIQAALDGLSSGRETKESVLVQGSGTISSGERISVPSYTILNICGTITAQGSGSGDYAPIYARDRTEIEIPHVSIAGTPLYAMFFRNVNNLHLGQVDIQVESGLGIRIDNHGGDRSVKVDNIRIDDVYVAGTSAHGVETYGANNVQIGKVVARDTGYSGLLLNDSTNVTVGLVDGDGAGTGTGYAAFRMANRNGRIADGYPTNIFVDQVIARGGGRGIFCVSESGGAHIEHVDLQDTGNNSVLIENCYNVTIASGTVTGGGDVRLAAREEFPNNADITFEDLSVTGTNVVESPCGENTTFSNVTVTDGNLDVCD